jgi:pyruvate dehydrogenase E1 component
MGQFEGLTQEALSSMRLPRQCAVRAAGHAAPERRRADVPAHLSFRPSSRCRRSRASASSCTSSHAADTELADAHRHRIARCHRVDQSRRLGQPARAVRQEGRSHLQGERIPSTFNWDFSPKGQHLELGIAEMNLFINVGLGPVEQHQRRAPAARSARSTIPSSSGSRSLNYACYQDARFMVVATPSGITLAPEGGAHQSIATPLIGMAQDGLASFEPAFVDELAVIMRWGFEHMQRDGGRPDERGCATSRRLGLSAALHAQHRAAAAHDDAGAAAGHHRRRLLAAQARRQLRSGDRLYRHAGAEAIEATGLLGEDRASACWRSPRPTVSMPAGQAARAAATGGNPQRLSHIEKLLQALPRDCGIVSVLDGHPATLAWLGSVCMVIAEGARRRAFRPDRHHRRSLSPLSASTRMRSSMRRRS